MGDIERQVWREARAMTRREVIRKSSSAKALWPANIPCRCERRKRVARIARRTSDTASGPILHLDRRAGFSYVADCAKPR